MSVLSKVHRAMIEIISHDLAVASESNERSKENTLDRARLRRL